MKSKFVKVLLIIIGILIPIYILFNIGGFLIKKLGKNLSINNSEIIEEEYKIKQSALVKVPNSENYMLAEYRSHDNLFDEYQKIDLPYNVPDWTVNIVFLDKKKNIKRKLLKENGSIKSMFISHECFNEEEMRQLSFYIANEDSNNDGEINVQDEHYLYISDLNGENLIKITDRKIKQYEWVNDNKDILLNFENENNFELKYGIYNIKKNELKQIESIK